MTDHNTGSATDELSQSFSPDRQWFRELRSKLKRWFRQHGRDLPWRRTSDLYAIWVSEIMLQQTQVATVIPYYEGFLEAFPNVVALAEADESHVLRQWEGLGYYRRARQMHAAAKQVMSAHGGRFPESFEAVLALPGIGRYTAGAILSFGLDRPYPIVEANTLRLFSRLLLLQEDPRKAAGQKRLWSFAEQALPPRGGGSGQVNQALMELGSVICTPKQPFCDKCPVAKLCPTQRHGVQAEIPVPAKRIVYEEVVEAAVVVRSGEHCLVRQCAVGERWQGLWDFLRFEVDAESPSQQDVMRGVHRMCGAMPSLPQPLSVIRYGVTRYKIKLHVYQAQLPVASRDGVVNESAQLQWQRLSELDALPLSVTGRKIHKLIDTCG